MSLKYYYEKELSLLHHEAHLFAKQFPEHAASLNMEKNKIQDPNVARLLEGCAFLTAKIHQMIDEEADHLPEQLIQRLWPQLSEGYPSHCIVQASVQKGLTHAHELPKGTLLASLRVGDEKTVCQFKTVASMMVAPVTLSSVTHGKEADEFICFEFKCRGTATFDSMNLDTLDIYLDTNMSKAQAILHALFSKKTTITVCVGDKKMDIPELRFIQPALEGHTEVYSQQLLLNAFCFPQALQWIQIHGLKNLHFTDNTNCFKLKVFISDPIDHSYQFSTEDFKLFCVPAINSYEHDAEPILFDHKHHRYSLVADHHRPESMHIQSVISAQGLAEVNQASIQYKALRHIIDSREPYFIFQSSGYLSFHTDKLVKQTVSVKTNICNHHYPRRYLRPGSLFMVEKNLDSLIKATNLHQPSQYLATESKRRKNDLLHILRVQIENFHSAEHLKLLLTLMNRGKNEAISNKINSIQSLHIKKRALVKRGVFHHVHSLLINFDESGFGSVSDRFAFGRLLHAYFQAAAHITTVVETTLMFYPSETSYTWLGTDG